MSNRCVIRNITSRRPSPSRTCSGRAASQGLLDESEDLGRSVDVDPNDSCVVICDDGHAVPPSRERTSLLASARERITAGHACKGPQPEGRASF
jgi:hypothetical protein